MLRAINNRILIEQEPLQQSVTEGGIHLTTDPSLRWGKVTSIGAEVRELTIGDRVAYNGYHAINIDGDVFQLRSEDVLGVNS